MPRPSEKGVRSSEDAELKQKRREEERRARREKREQAKSKKKVKENKPKYGFVSLWKRRIVDLGRKNVSSYPKLRNYNFYTNGMATFSEKDLVTYYYTIDGYPREILVDFRDNLRQEVREGVRISFLGIFEPTRIDWNSPKMQSKLRTWRTIEEEQGDVDEFNYNKNMASLDSSEWRKQSLIYLSDADSRRKRRMFKYRSMLLIVGQRGENFDKTVYEVVELAKSYGLKMNRVEENISDYLRYFSPFTLEYNQGALQGVGSPSIPDEILARFNTYDQGKIGQGGIYWGSDIYSGFPVYKRVKKESVSAENILVTAETGGGKSFFLKVLLLQLIAMPQYNGTINDIEGFEYVPFAGFLANSGVDSVVILNMAEGQGCYFDPVEINLTGDRELDRDMFSFSNSFTLAIIKTLLGKTLAEDDWSNVVVNNAVSSVYSKAGVDVKNIDTWGNSKGLTLFHVYEEFKNLYQECLEISNKYGEGDQDFKEITEGELDVSLEYKRNIKYREALDLVIAKLSAYFEDLAHGGVRSNVFTERITLDNIRQAKLVICSFGMAGKSPSSVDPIQMSLSQLSASNISHIRSIFSKAENKYNFKVWEEFQRWGSFPDADSAIKTALTGGRKLGDINFIVTNNVKEILTNDRFAIFDNITTSCIGAIVDNETREMLCTRLSMPAMKPELDNLIQKKGDTESFAREEEMATSIYDKAFLLNLDQSVFTITKMSIPDYLARSEMFRTGVNVS